jgi:hypothetical protein
MLYQMLYIIICCSRAAQWQPEALSGLPGNERGGSERSVYCGKLRIILGNRGRKRGGGKEVFYVKDVSIAAFM